MKKLLYYLLPVVIIATFSPDASALWLPGYSSFPQYFNPDYDIEIEYLPNSGCLITINFPGLETVADGSTSQLAFLGDSPDGKAPAISGFLVYPENASCNVQIIENSHEQHVLSLDLFEYPEFMSSFVPIIKSESGAVSIGDPGIMRGAHLLPINFKPYEYIESTNEILVTSRIVIEITFDGGITPPALSVRFSDLLDELAWNYSPGSTDEFIPSSYIIITPDEFVEELQPLADWKNKKGVDTEIVRFSDIGATSTNEQIIKDYLSTLYQTPESPEYVLLVGDETQFPVHYVYTPDPPTIFSWYSYAGNYTNDNYFACLDGDDYFPDVFVGRFVAGNSTSILKLVNKIVSYEKTPYLAELDWYDRGLVCSDMTEPTQRTTKLQVREWMLDEGGFTQVDTIFGDGGVVQFMSNVNSGRSFVNYRGTGWDSGWSGVQVYTSTLAGLTNVHKFPVVTGIGCGVAKYDGNFVCFGEVWMNSGSPNNPTGAVAFFGPTWNTHTYYNDALDEGIYSALWQDSIRTMAPALVAGKMSVQAEFAPYIAVYESVEEVVRTLFGQYTLFSDPELLTRASVPRTLTVTRTDSIFLGPAEVDVSVADQAGTPLEGIQVALYSQIENEIYVDATSPDGTVSFNVNLEMMPNKLYLTVTGVDVNPFLDSVLVYSNEAYVAHFEYEFTEDPPGDGLLAPGEEIILSERIKNFGAQPANDVHGILSCDYPGAVITEDSAYFGDIIPGGSQWGETGYRFTAPQVIDDQYLAMDMNVAAEEGEWVSQIYLDVYQPNINFDLSTLYPGPDGLLERGGEAFIEVYITNTGNLPAANLIGTLTSLDPEAVIIDGEFHFDSLYVNESKNNEEEPFVFAVSGLCPYDFLAHFNLNISGDQGTFQYDRDFEFEYLIGDPTSSDPATDVQNLYYAYESRDANYSQSPDYNWTEISPALGGAGTLIEFDQASEIVRLDLPFDFVYYGDNFNQITVSADGFITGDPIEATVTPLWSFIHPEGVEGTVAPMWHDFAPDGGTDGDASYYFDQNNGSFRIEYRNWPHAGIPGNRETFQIILYDQNARPTPTGDTEIEFQFASTEPFSQFTSHCGIENPDETDGIAIYQMYALYPPTSWPPLPNTAIKFTTVLPNYVGVDDEPAVVSLIPSTMYLEQNYPNPFNPLTTVNFGLPEDAEVKLAVYNILGRNVATLQDGYLKAGVHSAKWNAGGNSSGIYFIRLESGGYAYTVKSILMK